MSTVKPTIEELRAVRVARAAELQRANEETVARIHAACLAAREAGVEATGAGVGSDNTERAALIAEIQRSHDAKADQLRAARLAAAKQLRDARLADAAGGGGGARVSLPEATMVVAENTDLPVATATVVSDVIDLTDLPDEVTPAPLAARELFIDLSDEPTEIIDLSSDDEMSVDADPTAGEPSLVEPLVTVEPLALDPAPPVEPLVTVEPLATVEGPPALVPPVEPLVAVEDAPALVPPVEPLATVEDAPALVPPVEPLATAEPLVAGPAVGTKRTRSTAVPAELIRLGPMAVAQFTGPAAAAGPPKKRVLRSRS